MNIWLANELEDEDGWWIFPASISGGSGGNFRDFESLPGLECCGYGGALSEGYARRSRFEAGFAAPGPFGIQTRPTPEAARIAILSIRCVVG